MKNENNKIVLDKVSKQIRKTFESICKNQGWDPTDKFLYEFQTLVSLCEVWNSLALSDAGVKQPKKNSRNLSEVKNKKI